MQMTSSGMLRRLLVPVAVCLFCVNFNSYRVESDGKHYYAFQQHLFGDPPIGKPSAYNFGLGLLNAPFYAAGRLGERAGVAGSLSPALPAAAYAAASIFYLLVATLLCRRLIHALGWPHENSATLLAVFGSPVWYYACFLPSLTHAVDAAIIALAAVLTLRLWREPSLQRAALAGMVLGLAMTVRPFNLGMVLGLAATLAVYRRWREGLAVAVSACLSAAVLALVPFMVGAGFTGVGPSGELGFYPLSPLRMLFTDHRGLFVWTPVTLLSAIGIAKVLRTGPRDGFVVALTAMAGGLLAMYSGFMTWDAGWSFSARFLSSLLPFYAVGLAAFLSSARAARRRAAMGLAVAATCWSLFIGFNHAFGTADQPDGATYIARAYVDGRRTPRDFFRLAWAYSRVRHVVERVTR
jgi:hypothetical protein